MPTKTAKLTVIIKELRKTKNKIFTGNEINQCSRHLIKQTSTTQFFSTSMIFCFHLDDIMTIVNENGAVWRSTSTVEWPLQSVNTIKIIILCDLYCKNGITNVSFVKRSLWIMSFIQTLSNWKKIKITYLTPLLPGSFLSLTPSTLYKYIKEKKNYPRTSSGPGQAEGSINSCDLVTAADDLLFGSVIFSHSVRF